MPDSDPIEAADLDLPEPDEAEHERRTPRDLDDDEPWVPAEPGLLALDENW